MISFFKSLLSDPDFLTNVQDQMSYKTKYLSFDRWIIVFLTIIFISTITFHLIARFKKVKFWRLCVFVLLSQLIYLIYDTSVISRADATIVAFDLEHIRFHSEDMFQNFTTLASIISFTIAAFLMVLLLYGTTPLMRQLFVILSLGSYSIAIEYIQFVSSKGHGELDDIEAAILGAALGVILETIAEILIHFTKYIKKTFQASHKSKNSSQI